MKEQIPDAAVAADRDQGISDLALEPLPTVLIMAGQRLGRVDPLAARHGVEHKCLVPLLGRPLIGYVLDAVDAAFPGARIVVSINDPAALAAESEARPYLDAGRMTVVPSAPNLLVSVLSASEGARFPLLMTTGDNVLMTPEALRSLHAFALAQHADAAALFARKEDVLAAHPEGQPRFWRLRDGEFSGCNTFWVKDRDAFQVGEIFRHGGQFLKFPRRFIAAFGVGTLVGFRLGLFTVDRVLERLSRRFGKRIRVQLADRGELAIDVDTEFSHKVAERLLRARDGVERSS
jgi:GTP:adenosylcobinamide-phosphate guanylyltransferase